MEPIQVMIEDLGRQVAQKSIEASEWKARALTAEAALRELADEGDDEADGLTVIDGDGE